MYQLEFTCCDSGCLLKEGLYNIRGIAQRQRNLLYQKPYNEQNYRLSKLMELKLTFSGVRKISYHVPSLGKVCKTALRKVYGISKSKIEVLLKKIEQDGLFIETDRRVRKTPRKLLPEARDTLFGFILSSDATESYYSNNNGPVISFSTFRNIFNRELKDVLSFRKFRVDTCQECDKCKNRLDKLRSLNNRSSRQDDEIRDLITHRSLHLRESEVRFASLRYDVTVLAAKVY